MVPEAYEELVFSKPFDPFVYPFLFISLIYFTANLPQVVSETYEELVFSEPAEVFWRRVGEQGLQPAPEPQLSCLAHVSAFNPQARLTIILFLRFHLCRPPVPADCANLMCSNVTW